MVDSPRALRIAERFTSRTFRLVTETVRYPDGSTGDLHVVRHPGAVAILPLLLAPLRIVLLSQYRHAAGRPIWEIPAGTRDRPGEPPARCARRELVEETGYRAGSIAPVGRFYTAPGFCDELMHLFVAWRLEAGEAIGRDADELIDVHVLSWVEASRMVREGRIEDAKTLVALLWLDAFLGRASRVE